IKLKQPEGQPNPIAWAVKGTSHVEAIQRARAQQQERERHERNRLLYVAMTRARDRLYVAGFEGKRGRDDDCWYDLIVDALKPSLDEVDLGNGRIGWRVEARQIAEHEKPSKKSDHQPEDVERPAFASRPAPAEPKLSVPLAPSRLEPYAPD